MVVSKIIGQTKQNVRVENFGYILWLCRRLLDRLNKMLELKILAGILISFNFYFKTVKKQ